MSGTKFTKRLRNAAGIAGVGMALALVAAPVIGAPGDATESAVTDVAAITAKLASDIRVEVSRQPKDATVETFEAGILFIVDQAGQPDNVVCAAFDQVRSEAATPANARAAMNNVCKQLRNRRGTGAIGNSGQQFAPTGFSAPVLSTGGGSSNYN